MTGCAHTLRKVQLAGHTACVMLNQARPVEHSGGDMKRPTCALPQWACAGAAHRHVTCLKVIIGCGVVAVVLALERVRVQDQEVDVVLGLAHDLKAQRSGSHAQSANSCLCLTKQCNSTLKSLASTASDLPCKPPCTAQ